MKIQVDTLESLPEAASQLLRFLEEKERKFVIFEGDLGAGKTTLIKELISLLGVSEAGSSPTFSILNEYFSVNYGTVYHFDFYRLEDEMEAFDIGIEEIFDQDAYIFIEWPERIKNLIPADVIKASLTVKDKKRTIELEVL